jgi:hypothetical protein
LDVPDHPATAAAAEAYSAGDLDLIAELEAQIWFDGMGRTAQQVDQSMRQLALEMNRLALAHEAKQLANTTYLICRRLRTTWWRIFHRH